MDILVQTPHRSPCDRYLRKLLILSSRLHPDWKPLGNLWVQILKPPLPCCVPDRDIFFSHKLYNI
jgi:hypothetical protein